MKKTLLLGAAAIVAASASADIPAIYENLQILGISSDGKTAYSENMGTLTLIDIATGNLTEYIGEENNGFVAGQGGCFTTDGMLVGATALGAAYLKDGQWIQLDVPNPQFDSYAQGVTPDGSLIVGMVGMAKMSTDDTDTPMQVPAAWSRNTDGTYGECQLLPYPEKDFSGRVPQYVTAFTPRADGNLVIGQVVDYSGSMTSVIYYTRDNSGKWSYNASLNKLCNPNGLVFPEVPGDAPETPQWTDFMTDEEKAAYDVAVEEWTNEGSGDHSTYPKYEDFASDEEKAAYAAAYAAWETAFASWNDKFMAYNAVLMQCFEEGVPVMMNNLYLSADNKSVVSTTSIRYEDPSNWTGISSSYTPITIDLETGKYDIKPHENIVISSLAADGTIFGWTESETVPRKAMVYKPGATEPVSLYGYYQEYAPETAAWIKENMIRDIEMYDYESGSWIPVHDVEFTGTPHVTPDLKVLATAVANVWDETVPVNIYSYVLPGSHAGVEGVADDAADSLKVSVFKGGRIAIEGEADTVTVFDADGRVMFNAAAADVIETGLASGAYIIKVTSVNGVKTVKAMF